jgi:hypothetical protein
VLTDGLQLANICFVLMKSIMSVDTIFDIKSLNNRN